MCVRVNLVSVILSWLEAYIFSILLLETLDKLDDFLGMYNLLKMT